MSDVPLGAMLSGGLDSSLIVAMMARHSSTPVQTFAVGFRGEGAVNELADARRVASWVGAEHHEMEIGLDEAPVDLAQLTWHMDEPIADLSALGFIALCELAARHVTVALSGQGADELLGGYRKHRAAAIADAWSTLPRPLGTLGAGALAHGPEQLRRLGRALATADPVERHLAMNRNMTPALRARLVRGDLAALDGGDAPPRASSVPSAASTRRRCRRRSTSTPSLACVDDMLHYFDRASMAHSLEVRVPFLDHHLVEFCARIPPSMKVHRASVTKYLLKRAARGWVPDEIIDKPKIGFFNQAVSGWFRAQASGASSEYLLDDGARYADILDRGEVHSAGVRARRRPATRGLLRRSCSDPDARGLAQDLPAAGPRRASAPGLVRPPDLTTRRRHHARRATRSSNLPRLAASLAPRPFRSIAWVVVDNGSTDGTQDLARSLAARAPVDRAHDDPARAGDHARRPQRAGAQRRHPRPVVGRSA